MESTVRRIHSLEVTREGEEITICVAGNGFLYHMVRIIAGTLMEVGRGVREPAHMEKILTHAVAYNIILQCGDVLR